MKAIAAIFGFIWRGLDGVRKVLHLIVLLGLFLIVGVALSPSIPIVPAKAALMLAPQGALVEQFAGDPFERAVAEAYGQSVRKLCCATWSIPSMRRARTSASK